MKSALEGIESVVLPVDAAGGVDSPDPVALLAHRAEPPALRGPRRWRRPTTRPRPWRPRRRSSGHGAPRPRVPVTRSRRDRVRDGTRRPVPSLALRTAVARSAPFRRVGRAAGAPAPSSTPRRTSPWTVTVRLRARGRARRPGRAGRDGAARRAAPPDGRADPTARADGRSGVASGRATCCGPCTAVDGIDRVDERRAPPRRRTGRSTPCPPTVSSGRRRRDVDVQVEPVVEP